MRLTAARLGDEGDDIAFAQRKLGVFPASGILDENTAARLRGAQYYMGLDVTGELDSKTYVALRNAK